MTPIENILIKHIEVISSAMPETKSLRGRSKINAGSLYGINKIRRLILDLALKGKLVEREEIRSHSCNSDEVIGGSKNILPGTWNYGRLGDIASLITKGTTPTSIGYAYQTSGIKFVKVENISEGHINLPSINQYISEEVDAALSRSRLKANDLLFSIAGTIGRACIVRDSDLPANTNQALAIIRGADEVFSPPFLLRQLNSFVADQIVIKARGGAMNNVSLSDLSNAMLVIPPYDEQLKISKKIDELMTLCDILEDKSIEANLSHINLVKNFLSVLISSDSNKSFEDNWKNIVNSFDVLFTTPDSIQELKYSLLELALMGRLVPHKDDEESSDQLLKQIENEKYRLIVKGLIKKEKSLPAITEQEKVFPLPKGWEWARLQTVIDVRDGTHDSPKESMDANSFPMVTSKDFSGGEINFSEAKRISAADHEEIAKRSFVEKFDILFSMIGGNIGNQVMVTTDQPFSIKNVALFKYYNKELTNPFFIKKYSEYLASKLQSSAVGGAQPFVSLGQLRALVIALPPKQEQRRIVEKLDQLLLLCDKLENYLKEANQLKKKIADALVEQALA